jgi:D-arabinose 1-dehydrogenase-like Zn-dependent alcohol dehydrogenase
MMRAAIIDEAGASPRVGEFAEPDPRDGEDVADVVATGIHPIVRSLAAGTHYGSDGVYPLVPGVDAVVRGGDGALRYSGFVRAPWGTLAERMAGRLGIPIPDGADPVAIAGGLNPGMSSWLPLVARADEVGALGTVLVLGVTGVAGRLAVQNAFELGAARVVGVGRDPDRLAEAGALGAQTVSPADGPDALAAALGGAPTIIIDYAWGAVAELAWEALAGRGLAEDTADVLHVEVGTAAGERASLPGSLLRSRRFTVRGAGAGSASLAAIIAQLPAYMELIATGTVVPSVRPFPLSRAAEAWTYSGPERAVVVPEGAAG